MPINTNPQITIWNRLEPRPRKKDFSRSLRSEVRDSLWFLTRQWQFGEFKGEDTGSAIHVTVDMETTQVNKISLRGLPAKSYNNLIPMETQAEKFAFKPDTTMRQEMGRHFLRLLTKEMEVAGLTADVSAAVASMKSNTDLHFILPAMDQDNGEFYGNLELWQTYSGIINGRSIDGGVIYTYLKAGGANVASDFFISPLASWIIPANAAGVKMMSWFERNYNQPVDETESAWDGQHLEYNFACSAPATGSSHSYLVADEYYSGKLDWYNFDFAPRPNGFDGSNPAAGFIKRQILSIIPRDLSFPGMPRPRWWEFEDGKVDLGKMNLNTTDVGAILFMEFALIYSNDWMVIPHAVNGGSICKIKSLLVKDCFGQLTSVLAAGAGDSTDWQRWSMFNLHTRGNAPATADTRLFIPPVARNIQESEPLETVNFMRDEMANMVWAVENVVPDQLGGTMRGVEAATRLRNYLQTVATTVTPPTFAPNDAQIRFQFATSVPENWIPFIPVRLGSVFERQIQLQRAAMPRIMDGITLARVRPRTDILRVGLDEDPIESYKIFEEEVPRSGAIVQSTWQRTRWYDGSYVTWMGRRKTNGRGEGNSGLKYDTILPK
jgi:hypothetical protein